MKVVYNACFGGFGLSEAGVRRYAELKGITLYPEASEYSAIMPPTYWTVPPDRRTGILSDEEFHTAPPAARVESNRRWSELVITEREIPRTDPHLVQAVEELGALANTRFSELKIAEVAAGTRYRIDEYDGSERVMTVDDYAWEVAT